MTVRLEAWVDGDLPLLRRLLGDPAMTEHLGGPETEEKIVARQARYEGLDPATGRMFKIVDEASGEPVGSVGYWEKDWRDTTVWETGWSVLPEFQGRGIAGDATRLAVVAARAEERHRWFHAFPRSRTPPRTRSAASSASSCSGPLTSSIRLATRCAATTGAWTCSPPAEPRTLRSC